MLGHKTLAEAERNTRDADQARLAIDAMAKLEGRSMNRIAQTESMVLGRNSKRTKNRSEQKRTGAP